MCLLPARRAKKCARLSEQRDTGLFHAICKSAPADIPNGTSRATPWRLSILKRVASSLKTELHTHTQWDLLIAHPPCTYLSNCCTRGFSLRVTPAEKVVKRWEDRAIAAVFFMQFMLADVPKIAVENPIGFMTKAYRKPDQYINPWMWAESKDDTENYHAKKTGLWLKNLPPLKGNGVFTSFDCGEAYGKWGSGKNKTWEDSRGGSDRSKTRSKTFPGIAKAMADQWG